PPALCRVAQTRRDRGDARTPDDGDDHDILDKEVVHFDEERGALDRVHLGLGRLPGPVVLVVAPAHDVPPLPLVRLRGDFQETNWSMKRCGSGWVIVVVYIWTSVEK